MALIFQIWIESDKNSEEIRNYFSSLGVIDANGQTYKILVYKSGITGSMITVDGISSAGINSIEDAEEMSAIGYQFYERLKSAPAFRYALVGVEVDEWRTIEELEAVPDEIASADGFVIRKLVYEKIGCSVKMEKFVEDYLWLPYKGEFYQQ